MVIGYAIIAVPTGIVTAELTSVARERPVTTRSCRHCSGSGHASDAVYCKHCGGRLEDPSVTG